METVVKQAREVGTSAGVLLPRSWLNKQVVVTLFQPSVEKIALDVLSYLYTINLNKEVRGIYLYGSYARGEATPESDIDVLVITGKTTKLINFDNYEILLVSEDNFAKNLSSNLNYFSILREAEVILNEELIGKYRNKKINLNFKTNLDEIERMIKINQEFIEDCKENKINVIDGTIYSLVLRARELYLINCLMRSKPYSKKNFIKYSGDNFYKAYERVKREKKEINDIKPEEAEALLNLSKKWLKELKD